jgi:alkyl sulfatase BDS1-like metallo-beta-lactamase superfamily hydrolase
MLNAGKWQEEILNSFIWPDEFAQSPWLASIYGHPYFIVQGILRRYHGWYDGNPSRLFPAKSAAIAREVVALAGDQDRVLARAKALHEEGQTQLALHLIDFAIQSQDPPDRGALELKSQWLQQLAAQEKSLIARNILLSGARQIGKELKGK